MPTFCLKKMQICPVFGRQEPCLRPRLGIRPSGGQTDPVGAMAKRLSEGVLWELKTTGAEEGGQEDAGRLAEGGQGGG